MSDDLREKITYLLHQELDGCDCKTHPSRSDIIYECQRLADAVLAVVNDAACICYKRSSLTPINAPVVVKNCPTHGWETK